MQVYYLLHLLPLHFLRLRLLNYWYAHDNGIYCSLKCWLKYILFIPATVGVEWLYQLLTVGDRHTHTHTHTHKYTHICTQQDCSGREIGPSQRPLLVNTKHEQKTGSHTPAGFEPQPQQAISLTYALDCAATGINLLKYLPPELWILKLFTQCILN